MADATMPATTHELAHCIVRTRFAALPEAVRHAGTRAFLNWVGCALGGCRHDAVAIAVAAAEGVASPFDGVIMEYINILFSHTDVPVMRSLELYREEAHREGRQ
jgi:MmgE/PrpD N-terminal domain